MLPGVFPEKVTTDIDFVDEAVVMWCSSYKNTFVGAGNLQMTTNKFWCEYFCTNSGPRFVKHITLGVDCMKKN